MAERITMPGCEGRPPLTRKQFRVWRFVRDYVQEHRHSPSCVEIAAGCRTDHPNTARCHLIALERKGYVALARDTPRGRLRIRFLDGRSNGAVIPVLVARVRFGRLSVGDADDPLRPGEVFNDATMAAVRVPDGRLTEVGLKAGDFAIVKRGGEPRAGARVLAVVNLKLAVVRKPRWTGVADAVRKWEAVAGCPDDPAAVDDARVLGELKGLIRKH